MNKKKVRKIRHHYYEDPDVHAYIQKLDHWSKSKFIRGATRAKMEKESYAHPPVVKKSK